MLSLLTLPPLPYIVFELLRYKQEDTTSDNQLVKQPESLDVIIMDVLPSQINYTFAGKNGYNVGVGDDNVTIVRGGQAPTRISLQGTFGARTIQRGIGYTDGFGRLKNFEKMFRKSQSIEGALVNNKPDEFGYIYGINFYDFTHLFWGAANLDTFNINKNAQVNTKVATYTLNLTGIGKLIDATPRDPMLRNLKLSTKVQEWFEKANESFEEFKRSSGFLSFVDELLADIETLGLILNTVDEMATEYLGIVDSVRSYGNVAIEGTTNLINGTPISTGNPFSFASLLGK